MSSESKDTTNSLSDKIKSGEIYSNGAEQTYDDLLDELENEDDVRIFIDGQIKRT